jgi:hypothetical protein
VHSFKHLLDDRHDSSPSRMQPLSGTPV